MSLIERLKAEVRGNPRRIVFPEGTDERILKAAQLAAQEGIALPILLGNVDEISDIALRIGLDIRMMQVIDPASSSKLAEYVIAYRKKRDIPPGAAARIVRRPLYFGAMMVKQGEADAMVSGIAHSTEDVLTASELIIGLSDGVFTPSSFFIMDIPGYSGPENSLLIFADAAVNPDPNSSQLADIAIASARSAVALLGWEPRVAMLSFSTKGSASHPLVDKVRQAIEIVKKRAPGLAIDGELQADAALVPEVAKRKIKENSAVAGIANILIFPNLDSANIAYKLVQRLAGAKAYGPILQGFALPVSDLSRGASVEDILGTITLMVKRVHAQ